MRLSTDQAEVTVDDAFVRTNTTKYRRYYHLYSESFDPGASGASWTDPDGNTVGGWELTATSQDLQATVDVHADWDAASDLTVEIRFEIAAAGSAPGDVVVLDLDVYLKGAGDAVTKSQNLSDSVTVDASAQWTMFEASFTIDYNAVGAGVDVGDIVKLVLTLNTASSDVDDVIINDGAFYYNTTHLGRESGDV